MSLRAIITFILAQIIFATTSVVYAAPKQMEVHFFDGDGIERGNGSVHFDPDASETIEIGGQPFESNLILDSIGFTVSGREGGVARYTVDDVAEPLSFWLETAEKELGWSNGQEEFLNQWQFGYDENRNLTMNFDDDRKSGSWSHHTINLEGYLQTGSGRFTIATAVPFGTKLTPAPTPEVDGTGSIGPLSIIFGLYVSVAAFFFKRS